MTKAVSRGKNSGVLAQVAALANVSSGTVSRVFNNSDLIPAETCMRVMDAARALKFRPRVGVRNRQIALITEPPCKTQMGGYVNSLTQYICFALSRANAEITMITEDHIDNLSAHWFDGVIGIAWEDKTIEKLKSLRNIPVVWTSDEHDGHFHSIGFDQYEIGRMAGDYLWSKGHRKVAVIHETDASGIKRASGLYQCYDRPGAAVLQIANSTAVHLAVKQVIDAGCTAIWVTGEDMKVLEINWLIQELAGKRVPEDISILGFENPGISEFQRPSLSTIYCPLHEIGEQAAAMILQSPPAALTKVMLPARLIERNSVIDIN